MWKPQNYCNFRVSSLLRICFSVSLLFFVSIYFVLCGCILRRIGTSTECRFPNCQAKCEMALRNFFCSSRGFLLHTAKSGVNYGNAEHGGQDGPKRLVVCSKQNVWKWEGCGHTKPRLNTSYIHRYIFIYTYIRHTRLCRRRQIGRTAEILLARETKNGNEETV